MEKKQLKLIFMAIKYESQVSFETKYIVFSLKSNKVK